MADGEGLFGIPQGIWQGGGAALGAGSDLFAWIENYRRQEAIRNIFNQLQSPQKLASYAGNLMPQYSPAAIGAINRGVNADWASMTGGAPGGAAQQFLADAWAKLISQNWANALGAAQGGLSQASQTAGSLPQSPLGALGGIMQKLAALRGIGAGGGGGLVAGFPMSGGQTPFAGGSEGFRGDYAPMPQFSGFGAEGF